MVAAVILVSVRVSDGGRTSGVATHIGRRSVCRVRPVAHASRKRAHTGVYGARGPDEFPPRELEHRQGAPGVGRFCRRASPVAQRKAAHLSVCRRQPAARLSSPYNSAVRFTPAIDEFARESETLTFTRAYTRYGGTGLSEPAIWSGALLPHKEYVTPFAPMNALEKLLASENYHRLISLDSILRQLLTPSPDVRELDAGIQNRQYETCRTLGEIRTVMPGARP